ncbi:hypothetical protein DQ04_01131130 [Trypanosoma grayi]|uniref:hypothetical protein n=1 Tax=Trypanosoma grayi TaxID=71804 RepID=UPI0004F45FB8|nr:hypothetical protein DQ04_01131130 [Trypanosoma grayi]KEG13244.1 hypothetical protein DQ04_01131130 [Trypanosoma grayi]
MASSAICPISGSMRPLFHFTADDAVILAMEHNNHSKLLAISTSKNEVFVTSTRNMPIKNTTTLEEDQARWDPAGVTVLIDRLRFPCTHLAWAPWQHGMYLACVCRGKQVRLYRLSHGHWSLDEVITVQDCSSVAFSVHFTMACACTKGKVLIFAQTTANEDGTWSPYSTYSLEEGNGAMTTSLKSRNRVVRGSTCVGWDETGSFLALGDEEGVLRVFNVSSEGRCLGEVAYTSDPLSGRGRRVLQVSWSPGAGRSFFILAVVTSYRVTLLFFRRARLGVLVCTQTNAASQQQLLLCAKTSSSMEEVTELSWNTNGTRFVTAHTDGAVCAWVVDISYQRNSRVPLGETEGEGDSGGNGMLHHTGASEPDDSLVLVTSIRKVPVVHPYHGGEQ